MAQPRLAEREAAQADVWLIRLLQPSLDILT